jgi:hypothetical protein
MVRDFYGPGSSLLIDVKFLAAEPHQYNLLLNVRGRLCVFAIDLRGGLGLWLATPTSSSMACCARSRCM